MLRGAGRDLVGGPPGAAGPLCILRGSGPAAFGRGSWSAASALRLAAGRNDLNQRPLFRLRQTCTNG